MNKLHYFSFVSILIMATGYCSIVMSAGLEHKQNNSFSENQTGHLTTELTNSNELLCRQQLIKNSSSESDLIFNQFSLFRQITANHDKQANSNYRIKPKSDVVGESFEAVFKLKLEQELTTKKNSDSSKQNSVGLLILLHFILAFAQLVFLLTSGRLY